MASIDKIYFTDKDINEAVEFLQFIEENEDRILKLTEFHIKDYISPTIELVALGYKTQDWLDCSMICNFPFSIDCWLARNCNNALIRERLYEQYGWEDLLTVHE